MKGGYGILCRAENHDAFHWKKQYK
jgi:hypothetical protein